MSVRSSSREHACDIDGICIIVATKFCFGSNNIPYHKQTNSFPDPDASNETKETCRWVVRCTDKMKGCRENCEGREKTDKQTEKVTESGRK